MGRERSKRELEQIQQQLEYKKDILRVFIADILPLEIKENKEIDDRMNELENLVNTYGGVVILKHIQNKQTPDYNTFLGSGKLEQIVEEMKEQGANLLIIGNILKSHQIYKINKYLTSIGAKAWDRVDLILKIFEKHAKSREAKLQIELAAIKHMGPRIFGMGMELSRQGAGIGTRGKGETNTEIMKRHLRKKEQKIKKELESYVKVRKEHRKSRQRKGLPTIGVVGYTNAGKSTLTNSLTKKGVLAEDKLFATLGTSVGKMWIEKGDYKGIEVLVNDTIGFIRELPPELIDAFSSTLEDSIESDLLLNVIDSTDPKIELKIKIVDDILFKIGANNKKIYVFNKIDELEEGEYIEQINDEEKKYKNKLEYLRQKFHSYNPVFISAFKKIGLDDLKNRIIEELGL